jgi:RNA polymerase sigma-70 factor, ECF subfamily
MEHTASHIHELYERYAPDVYRFSYWLSGDADDAKDLTSETFVRLWTSGSEIRNGTIKAYLFTIARNIYLRRQQRSRRFVPLENVPEERIAATDTDTDVRFELEHISEMLQILPEIDRTLIILRADDGLPYDEIARVTGLSLATVKVRLFRARMKLQKLTSQ